MTSEGEFTRILPKLRRRDIWHRKGSLTCRQRAMLHMRPRLHFPSNWQPGFQVKSHFEKQNSSLKGDGVKNYGVSEGWVMNVCSLLEIERVFASELRDLIALGKELPWWNSMNIYFRINISRKSYHRIHGLRKGWLIARMYSSPRSGLHTSSDPGWSGTKL